MTAHDIFISYNREDAAKARLFAKSFEREGFSVWWDAALKSGDAYDQVTEAALNSARAVVVLWSPRSVNSRWVRAEATVADRNKTLMPVMIEACVRPVMFELTQSAQLEHWKGDRKDPAWRNLVESIKPLVYASDVAVPSLPALPGSAITRWKSKQLRLAAAIAFLVVAVFAGWYLTSRTDQPLPERIAIFGFKAPPDQNVALGSAGRITQIIFDRFSADGLDVVSRDQTIPYVGTNQSERARQLGATYALSGDVQEVPEGLSIGIRLEDVASQKTLWVGSIKGALANANVLEERAATQAKTILDCNRQFRNLVLSRKDEVARTVASLCDDRVNDYKNFIPLLRRLASLVPEDPAIQIWLASNLDDFLPSYPPAQRPAIEKEIDDLLARTKTLDPKNIQADLLSSEIAIRRNQPLEKAERLMLQSFNSNKNDFFINSAYGSFLLAVGRSRDALPLVTLAHRQQSDSSYMRLSLAIALGQAGKPLEGAKLLLQANDLLPSESVWAEQVIYSAYFGLGDSESFLAKPPTQASPDLANCLRKFVDIRKAGASGGKLALNGIEDCVSRDVLPSDTILLAMSAAGDIDGFFRKSPEILSRRNFMGSTAIQWLFSPDASKVRADPRFVELTRRLGLLDYWNATRTRPDFCGNPREQAFSVCAEVERARVARR